MIPDGFQCISVTYDQGVGTLLVRGVKGGIFRFGLIGGIESGTDGFGAISLQEGFPVDAVPGAVVDVGVLPFRFRGERGKELLFGTEILLPVDFVHFN